MNRQKITKTQRELEVYLRENEGIKDRHEEKNNNNSYLFPNLKQCPNYCDE